MLLLSHDGVPCALPAAQVVSAAAGADAPEIRLFQRAQPATLGEDRDPSAVRTVLVHTPAGLRRVDCSEARVATLDAELHPLPELLRRCLGLPHVVGVAVASDGLRWLVDLEAWEDR